MWKWAGLGLIGAGPRGGDLGGAELSGGGVPTGRGQAPLPGLRARQDPQDVRLLVASHTLQGAAADRALGVRPPFEPGAHVHVGLETAGGREPRGCRDKRAQSPSGAAWHLTPRPALSHGRGRADRMGHGKWGAWEDQRSHLPSTAYCPETHGKSPPRLWFLIINPGLTQGMDMAHDRGAALGPEHLLAHDLKPVSCTDWCVYPPTRGGVCSQEVPKCLAQGLAHSRCTQ